MARDRCAVLFVMAPGGFSRHFSEHLGTAYLRSVLARAGIRSRQYLPDVDPGLAGFASALRELRPRVVGFTAYESNLIISRAMVRVVRATLPEAAILVGGPNATFSPEETLGLVEADACLRGAGESAVVPLVTALLGVAVPTTPSLDRLLGSIPNLVVRTPEGPRRTPTGSLSSIPGGEFRTLDDVPSPFQDGTVSTPDVGYLTARGCNQSCTYCSFAAISGHRVAFHGVERVLDDLEALEDLARRVPPRHAEIHVCDDAFTIAPERARRICEGILGRGIRLRLRCEARGDQVDARLLALMRRAGFASIGFGLESAVPRVLRTIGKVRPPSAAGAPDCRAEAEYLERFRSAVKAAKRCGLEVTVSVIGGLPGETEEDFRSTLAFVSSLDVKVYSHNLLNVFPGTPLYDRRGEFGLDAFRDASSQEWRTLHAYPVGDVEPLAQSTVHLANWSDAQTLSDALCGRPGETDTAEDSAPAVVLHGGRRSQARAAWLRRTLAIGGAVAVFAPSRSAAARWKAFLVRSGVPFGSLSCLVPDGSAEAPAFVALGPPGDPRVRFVRSCSPETARCPVEVNARGECRFSVWVASAPDARVEGRMTRTRALAGAGLQIADSCRLWEAAPSCRRPRVLHVDAADGVRACWHGPRIGSVGDDLPALARRSRAIVASRGKRRNGRATGCPLAPPKGTNRETLSRLWDLDLSSQLGWLFPAGMGAGVPAASDARERSDT